MCDNWFAVEKSDGLVDRVIPVASIKELKSFAHLFSQSVKKKFSDGHLWFSVFSRPVRSNFTRLQRISCCISLLFCTMISNAMFYRQDTQGTSNKAGVLMKIGPIQFTLTQLWISFIGTLIVLPINIIIVTLFRKAKYSQKTLITHHLKEIKRRNKPFEKDEQVEKTKKFYSCYLLFFSKEKTNFYLDFFYDQKNRMKMKLNVLLQYHQLKIKHEHFHIGLFISHGDVRLNLGIFFS
jgi:hypothetical protein